MLASVHLGLNSSLIGILLAVSVLLMALSLPYSGKIADRFNRRALVIIGSLINVSFLALIPLFHSFWQLLGLCALGALGVGIAMPAASAMTVDEGRKFGMGSTMGISTMAMSIGMAIGPLLGGVMTDFVNIGSVFYLGAAMALLGTSLFTWFTR
ncbi:MFS transporter [Chloroflexota bacterium]